MTADQRDQLLDLHRAATKALSALEVGGGRSDLHDAYYSADDAFRDYLFSLDVTE